MTFAGVNVCSIGDTDASTTSGDDGHSVCINDKVYVVASPVDGVIATAHCISTIPLSHSESDK